MIHGGLKLNPKVKRPNGFDPIYDMIAKGSMEILSLSSLTGFIVTLTVPAYDSAYLNLKGSDFTQPVTDYILKFAVITRKVERFPLYNISKRSETPDSYLQEAKLQQHVWEKSISEGRPPICPSIANFSLFETDQAKNLCTFLSVKSRANLKLKKLFNDLLDICEERQLGVIVMPKIDGSETLDTLRYSRRPPDDPSPETIWGQWRRAEAQEDHSFVMKVCANVFAQVARMFLEIGVVHCDLHQNNILVNVEDGVVHTRLIDFGMATTLLDHESDDYLTSTQKSEIDASRVTLYDELKNPQNPIEYMKRVLRLIIGIDHTSYQQRHPDIHDKTHYQMDWYREFLDPRISDIFHETTFRLLVQMTTAKPSGLQQKQIDKYKLMNELVNLESMDHYATVEQCGRGCSISGGRKTNKKIKRSKKLNRYRGTRKPYT